MLAAKIADHRKIWIATIWNANIGGRECMPVAAACEHCSHRFFLECDDQAPGRLGSKPGKTPRPRRFVHRLTVGEIAKIKLGMTPSSRPKIRARHHRLRLQCFERSARKGFS